MRGEGRGREDGPDAVVEPRARPGEPPTSEEEVALERRLDAEEELALARTRTKSRRNLSLFWTGLATMYLTWGVMGEGSPAWILFVVLVTIAAVSWGRFAARRREEADAVRRLRALEEPPPGPTT